MDKLTFLDIPLFEDLDRIHKAKILSECQQEDLSEGETIFEEGQFGDCLYIIVQGAVRIFFEEDGQERTLAVLKKKEAFGEMALLTGDPRSASAMADTDAVLLRLDKETFDRLLYAHNEFAVQFAGILARRLSRVNRQETEDDNAMNESVQEAEHIERKAERVEAKDEWLRTVQEQEKSSHQNYKKTFGLVFAILAGVAAYFLLKASPWALYAAILLAGSIAVAFRTFSLLHGAAWMGVAAVLFSESAPTKMLIGFSSPAWLLAFSLALAGYAIVYTGVFERLFMWVAYRVPPTSVFYTVLLRALAILGSFLIPPVKPREETLQTVLPDESKRLTVSMTSFLFLHSSLFALFAYGLLPAEAQKTVSLFNWFFASAPLVLLIVSFDRVGSMLIRRPKRSQEEKMGSGSRAEEQLAVMGRPALKDMSAALILLGLTVSLWIVPVPSTMLYWLLAGGLLTLAVTSVLQERSLRLVPYQWLLTFGLLTGFMGMWRATGFSPPWTEWPITVLFMSLFVTVTVASIIIPSLLAFMIGFALFGEALLGAGIHPLLPLLVGLAAAAPHSRMFDSDLNGKHILQKVASVGLAVLCVFPIWHLQDLTGTHAIPAGTDEHASSKNVRLHVVLPDDSQKALKIRRGVDVSQEMGVASDVAIRFAKQHETLDESTQNVLSISSSVKASTMLNESSTVNELLDQTAEKRFAVYYHPDSFGHAFARKFEREANERDNIVTDRLPGPLSSSEWSTAIHKWDRLGTDAIVIYDPFDQLTDRWQTFMANYAEGDSRDLSAFSDIFLVSPSRLGAFEAPAGVRMTYLTSSLRSKEPTLSFIEAYKDRYGYWPNAIAIQTYEALANWESSEERSRAK